MLTLVVVVVVRVPEKTTTGVVVVVVVEVTEVLVKVSVLLVPLTTTLVVLLVFVLRTDRVRVDEVLRVVKDKLSEVATHVLVQVLVVLVLTVRTTSVVTWVGRVRSTMLMVVRVPLMVLVMQ